jgi:CTP-dependent riboflavin kinase
VASNAYLARKLHVTIASIKKSLTHLKKYEYIDREVKRKGRKIVKRYITINPACVEKFKRLVFEEIKDEFME